MHAELNTRSTLRTEPVQGGHVPGDVDRCITVSLHVRVGCVAQRVSLIKIGPDLPRAAEEELTRFFYLDPLSTQGNAVNSASTVHPLDLSPVGQQPAEE